VSAREYVSVAGALLGTREKVILSFIVGFLIGLIIFGWWLWPVQWKDAAPSDLQADWKDIYLNMVAYIHETTPSADVATMLSSWNEEQLTQDLNQAYANATDSASQTRLANLGREAGVDVTGVVPE
jgi:hypothetical protein